MEDRLAPAILTVNSNADTVSGTTATLDLREAIALVNTGGTATDSSGDSLSTAKASQINTTQPYGSNDTIVFASSLSGETITLGGSALEITSSVTITGPGANNLAISGNNLSRVFAIVDSGAPVSISGLTIEDGNAGISVGGGLLNENYSNLTVSNCTFFDNTASSGGALGNGSNTLLDVTNCTFDSNSATGEYTGGGAIYNEISPLTVTNSTLTGNSAYYGGGILNSFGGTLTVTNSTLAANSASEGGGGIAENFGSTTLNNTIVANSTSGGDMDNLESGTSSTFSGSNDLIGDGSSLSSFTNSLQGDPLLAALGNYGGPTQTMPLLPGSPAIDAGSNALAVDANGNALTTDQRGDARIVNGVVDIGAFESTGATLATLLQQVLTSTYPVSVQANTTTDADNIISAVNALPSYSSNPVTVTVNLAANTSYGDLNLSPPSGVTLVINGQGGTTTIVGNSPALTVASGTVIVTNETLTTATADPTILVTGGSLELRNDDIESSTGFAEPAISITGGSLDLGTNAGTDPGNNIININGTGSWIQNTTASVIPDAGNTFEINGTAVPASTFVVTTTADSGLGSLRQAILNADAYSGSSSIIFYIPTYDSGYNSSTNTWTITPVSALPTITEPVVLNATTQPGYSTAPLIELDGANAGSGVTGLTVTSGNSTIEGLDIGGFSGDGIDLASNGSNLVEANYIGTDSSGAVALPNLVGIRIEDGSSTNTIGGTTPGDRNIISGNTVGVQIQDTGSTGNVVEGNYIGTDLSGMMAVSNYNGVVVYTNNNTIGGTAAGAGNVISGNNEYGVYLDGSAANENSVQGNYIGVDHTGNTALGNPFGVGIQNGQGNVIGVDTSTTTTAGGNVISGNRYNVQIYASSDNLIAGNMVGLGADGSTVVSKSTWAGITIYGGGSGNIVGGTTPAARNVISGNGDYGIEIGYLDGTSGDMIEGNYIGTDATGTQARPNYPFYYGGFGVWFLGAGASILGGTAPGAGNVISGNEGIGVYLSDGTTGVQVEGNDIGVNATGTSALGNTVDGVLISGPSGLVGSGTGGSTNNTIGGTVPGSANVISGNGAAGGSDVVITTTAGPGNVVEGNYIGTGVQGTDLLNSGNPVFVVTTTNDSGPGSLRQAILNANAYYGTATITFDIPTSDSGYNASTETWTIQPQSALPIITEAVVLDATTQPGYTSSPLVELDGVDAGSGVSGLTITAGNSVIKGLDIGGFSNDGIDLTTIGGNVVQGDYLGTDVTGTMALANGNLGIRIEEGSSNNQIGGTTALERNIISGNGYAGVQIQDNGSNGNVVEGNYIGTDVTGTLAVPNNIGLNVQTNDDVIAGNVISGNNGDAIDLSNGQGNVVQGNYIGVDKSGNSALRNAGFGISLYYANFDIIGFDDTTNTGVGNVISGNRHGGMAVVQSSNNIIAGNEIGLGADGSSLIGDGGNGGISLYANSTANVIGGTTAAARNVVSDDANYGIVIGNDDGTSGNMVEGNYIGTDATGTQARTNVGASYGPFGVWFFGAGANILGGTAPGAGNVISGNEGFGVYLSDGTTGVQVEGNDIGVNATGTSALGNTVDGVVITGPSGLTSHGNGGTTNNTIGGTVPGSANVISGNGAAGGSDVVITTTAGPGNVVEGNYIGTGVQGTDLLNSGNPVFVVTTTNDSGPGSLRQAISDANAYYGTASITFDIPTTDSGYNPSTETWTIQPQSALPIITEAVVLDATTQPGYVSSPLIELDGVDAGSGVSGLTITAGNSVIKGLDIGGFSNDGIDLTTIGGNVVQSDYIGTDVTGSMAIPNGNLGIRIEGGSSNNQIGGTTALERNIISGNGYAGVQIQDNGSNGNVVEGNYIGTDFSGLMAVPNGYGVVVYTNNNKIGGTAPGAGNVISGNNSRGVYLINTESDFVQGNFIGVNKTGNEKLGNTTGIDIAGGQDNVIGFDAAANTTGGGNVISGNGDYGIGIEGGSDNVVAGNLVGLGTNGSTVIGNVGDGGIVLDALTTGNLIGGTTPAARNVVSGNPNYGIDIGSDDGTSGNTIEGNYIGTDATGLLARPNGVGVWFLGAGANTLGGTVPGAGNVISGNATSGVYLSDGTTEVQVEGNNIGVNATGTAALGNNNNGVAISGPSGVAGNGTGGSTNNTIGGTVPGSANVISGNGGAGVAVIGATTTGNSIEGNSIYDNTGLGIDLGDNGVTPNGSGPIGPNNLENYPVLNDAFAGTQTSISGTLNSLPSTTFTVDFYSDPVADPSGHGQGQTYLGSTVVTTDSSGNASFSVNLGVATTAGEVVTATATDSNGNTSEFAADVALTSSPPTASLSGPTTGVLYQPLTFTLGASDVSPIEQADPFTYTINWGDGTTAHPDLQTVVGPSSTTVTHAYITAGPYNVTLTATAEDGGVSTQVSQTTTISATYLFQNGVLSIPGTAANATFTFTPTLPTNGSAYSMKVTETVGTNTTTLGTFAASVINIYGSPGTDDVVLNGTTKTDAFTMGSNTVNEQVAIGTTQSTAFTVGLNSVKGLTLNGSGGTDSLTGPNQANTWDITGSNTGTLDGTTAFSAIQNLTAGTVVDTFSFLNNSASVSGVITGGGASDILDFSDRTTAVTVTMEATGSKKATATGGWTNIGTVLGATLPTGATTLNTLVGANTTNTWDLNSTNAGTLDGTLNFSGFQNLTGGSANDTFAFLPGGSLAGTLNGGSGTNTLDYSQYNTPVTANLQTKTATALVGTWTNIQAINGTNTTDTLIGSNANSTWSLTGANSGTVSGIAFAGFANLIGGTGNDTFQVTPATSVSGSIDGGSGSNTLIGANVRNTWDLTGSNAGTLNGTLAFSDMLNLTGGSVNDTFMFQPGASLAGNVNGSSPTNTLNYAQYGSAVTVNLQTKTATAIGGTWANIQDFNGTNTTDTLIGPNANSTWTVTGANSGTVSGYTFTGFANLMGGSGNDTFKLTPTASISGSIDGGIGSNTLDGANVSNTWKVTGSNAGTVNGTLTFADFQNLTGGSAGNTFTFQPGASLAGNLNGTAATSTLDYAQYGSAVTVNLQTKTATAISGTWTNIQVFKGTNTTDTLIGPNATITWTLTGTNAVTVGTSTFSGFANLTAGSSGNDTFSFDNGAGITGVIKGGSGTNLLNYSRYTSGIYANLQTATATGTGGIANIQNITGSGQGNDILVGNSSANVLSDQGKTSGIDLIIGGGGTDSLTAGNGGDILIDGTTNYDTNAAALDALLASWANRSLSYAQREAALLTGVSYGDGQTASLVADSTVNANPGASPSTLTGGSGQDVFFASVGDTIKNKSGKTVYYF